MSLLKAVYCAFVLSIPLDTMLFFKTDEQSQSGVSVSRGLGALLFVLAIIDRNVAFRRVPAAFWLVVWYVSAFTVSELWVPAQLGGMFRELQVTLVQMSVLFLISANLLSDDEFRPRLLRVFGWGMCALAASMLLGLFGIQMDFESRRSIASQNPNTIGVMFALGGLCLAGDRRVMDSDRRLPYALASLLGTAILLIGIMKTGSRGALLAFSAGAIGLILAGGRNSLKARAVLAVGLTAVLGLMLAREFRHGSAMAKRLQRSISDGDSAGRTDIYNVSWQMFQERPLLGYGGANNRFMLGTYLNYAVRGTGAADRDPHNTYFSVLTEVGLIGGIPFFTALLIGVFRSWRFASRRGDGLPFALMCALITSSSVGTETRHKLFWILFACAVACRPRAPTRSAFILPSAAVVTSPDGGYEIAHG